MSHAPHKLALIHQLQCLPLCAGPVLPHTVWPACKYLACRAKKRSEITLLHVYFIVVGNTSVVADHAVHQGERTRAHVCGVPTADCLLLYACLCTCSHGCQAALFHYLLFQDLHQSTCESLVDLCLTVIMCWCLYCSCRSPPVRLDCRGTHSRRVLGAALCCTCRGSIGCAGSLASCRITGLGLYVLLSYLPVVSSMLCVVLWPAADYTLKHY
jgi:hypothetical protein